MIPCYLCVDNLFFNCHMKLANNHSHVREAIILARFIFNALLYNKLHWCIFILTIELNKPGYEIERRPRNYKNLLRRQANAGIRSGACNNIVRKINTIWD